MKSLTYLAFCLAACVCTQAAEAAATIQFGGAPAELVISEVSERTMRLELTPLDEQGKPRAATPSTVLVPFPTTEKLRTRELAGAKEILVGKLRVTVKPLPLTVTVRREDGKLVQELIFDEDPSVKSIGFHTDAPVLGMGEGEQQFDRREHDYPMRNGQIAPLLATHGATIPVPFLIGTDGWAMFVHRPWGTIDMRGGKGKFLPVNAPNGREPLEMFIVNAAEPADALAEYIRLTGSPIMPPKWVMGYIQSHRTLANPAEPLQIAKTFREKNLPCDALIYLGTGYCTNGWNIANGTLIFNTNAFDHPAENIKALQAEHFKVVLHVTGAPRNMFGNSITDASESPNHISNYWKRHLEDFSLGVDAWWPDDGDELPIEARLARHRLYYDGPTHERPNERPWSLNRNGYAGVQRYGGWIWSGDNTTRWATLAAHVPVGLNFSLSLTPFWGTDTGGFVITRELTGEVYTRWFQFSAFNPLFRSHGRNWHLRLPWGWNTGDIGIPEPRDVTDPAELHNAEVEPIARKYLELRYRLLPYNYTLMREACDTGMPPMRALWLHYKDDPEAVKLGDEYLWGRDLLVAPVVEKGAKSRKVYLPAGDWFDWWTGEKLAGKRWIERPVDLATMPMYVRAGAIVPLDPVRQYTAQAVTEPTALRIHPGTNGSYTMYDDDGQSLGYKNGTDTKTVWIRFLWDDKTRELTIEPDARMKNWPGGTRVYSVETAGSTAKPKQIEFSGKRVSVSL